MRFSLALSALAPILSVYADNILVMVGANNQLAFSPPNVTANVGDVISFQFQSKNHSVTQSTFGSPCTTQTTPKQGIDSDFQFVGAPGAAMLPQFSFNVTDLNPLWFYCAQTNPASHCSAGMVFSVNADPSSPKSFAAFQALAMGVNGAAAGSSVLSEATGAIATATSAIASDFNHATSALPSVVAGVTSAAAGAVNTATSELPSIISDATSAIEGAAGAAASAAAGAAAAAGKAFTGAGVRVGPNTIAALLLAVVVFAPGMLL